MDFQKIYKVNLIIVIFFYYGQINSVTFVYNLRISETTKSQRQQIQNGSPSIAALTLVNQFRKRRDLSRERIIGGLATYIYSPKNYYVRADFAFANLKQRIGELSFSRTQTDDILFSGGISKKLTDQTKITFSGLLGVPTHRDFALDPGIQFGTGHFGIGVQADGSFSYMKERKHLILGATRFVYFLPSTLKFTAINNTDLKFDFNPGNLVDLLIAHQSIWKKNRIEVGYNVTFAFGASINPTIGDLLDRAKFIRSSFFASYAHAFLIKNHIAGIILGTSYSFDHVPKIFGYKQIVSFWITGGINF